MRMLVIVAVVAIAGCGPSKESGAFTLYRNSALSNNVRVHWATFNAGDGANYNLGNCQMAARLLNANILASAKAKGHEPNPKVGFWCEAGSYSETGGNPIKFDAEFPSDTTGPM